MCQEENKSLRLQNENLYEKLEKSEAVLSRVREELARCRAASGRKPYVDIDEEEKLRRKLDVCTTFCFKNMHALLLYPKDMQAGQFQLCSQ